MKELLFIFSLLTLISSANLFAQEIQVPGMALTYHLDTSTGELTLHGGEVLKLPYLLGNMAPWAAVKLNQGLKNKYTSSSKNLACIGDLEFMTTAACENGQTEVPASIKDSENIDKQKYNKYFIRNLRYLLSMMPIPGGTGYLKDLLIRNTPNGGSALLVRNINCDMDTLHGDALCVIKADAFIKN